MGAKGSSCRLSSADECSLKVLEQMQTASLRSRLRNIFINVGNSLSYQRRLLSDLCCCNSYYDQNWPELSYCAVKSHQALISLSPPPQTTDRQNRWSGINLKPKQWPHDRKNRLSILPHADLIRKKQCSAVTQAENNVLWGVQTVKSITFCFSFFKKQFAKEM